MSIDVERSAGRRLPPWLVPGLAVAVVAAIGVVFATADFSGEESAETTPSVTFASQTLNRQVEDFDGTLVASLTLARIPSHLTWAAGTEQPTAFPTATRDMRLNGDATQIAGIDLIGDRSGDLWVGPPGDTRAITQNVTAFAWHRTDPGRIALSRVLAETSLWVATVGPDDPFSVNLVANTDRGSEVVAFGEWGYALHSAPDADGNRTTIVLDSQGAETARIPGLVVYTRAGVSGGVLVADPLGADLTATWSGEPDPAAVRFAQARILNVRWSTGFGSYAELSDGDEPGIDVLYVSVSTDDGEVTHLLEGIDPIAWDPSGRFLVGSSDVRLVVVDGLDGSVHEVGVPPTRVYDARLLESVTPPNG